ncbi:MAG TPA: hypothetical protein VNW92_01700, partial [Polyangiaceae bacterium]|nr:hypothetical protein [Polyangiaceae bacterium]
MEQRVWGFAWLKLGLCSAGLLALCGACSSPGGSGGAAGAANAGGSGGTSADQGGAAGTASGHAGTSASSGGTSAAAGSAGASACHAERATDPKLVAPTQYDASLIALAAAVVGSCLPDDGVDRNASYAWSGQAASGRFYYRTQLQAECLAHSACGCAAVEHCLGFAIAPSPSCTSGCTGDVFTECRPNHTDNTILSNTIDCSSVGLSCDPIASCTDGTAEACDATAFTPT